MRAGVEQSKVERVLGHLQLMVLRGDVARVAGGGEPEENIRASDGEDGAELLGGREKRPRGREEHVFTTGEQSQEKDEDGRVPVVQHVSAETAEERTQAATGDFAVQ